MGARASLVPFGEPHVDASAGWLADPRLRAALDTTAAPEPQENRAYWKRRLADPAERCFAIIDSGMHVGNCGLRIDAARKKAELWIYLGERRGEGIGREVVEDLVRLGFDELGLHRIFLRAVSTNEAAVRFWRRCGFVEEGRWREDTWVGGRPADSLWFGLLRREWENRGDMDAR